MQLGTVLKEFQNFSNRHEDDLVDRYNHRYTVFFLAFFILIIATKQYYGEPIICWTPAYFSGSHSAYANTICWTHGTYPVVGDQPYHTVDRTQVLPYYQWVPFILLFQAACFLVPNVIWHTFSKSAGVDITALGKNASVLDHFDIDNRRSMIGQIARHIHVAISLKYDYQPTLKGVNVRARLPFGRRQGNYLYLLYMLVKLIYIFNLIGQLFLMNSFFGFHHYRFGLDFLTKFLVGDDYSRIDKAFPRITFCDFKIRNLGDNIHQHSVQCALPINLFNEKFFIVLWFWLIFLTIITVCNFISWIKTMFRSYRYKSITKYLRVHGKLGESEKDKEMFDTFVNDYCYLDGAFICQILRRNSNYITTSEIICSLWSRFCVDFARHQRYGGQVGGLTSSGTAAACHKVSNDSVEIGMNEYEENPEKKPLTHQRISSNNNSSDV